MANYFRLTSAEALLTAHGKLEIVDHRVNLLRPMLQQWLVDARLQGEIGNSIPIYETPYDPRLVHGTDPITSCLWTGYTPKDERFMQAFNDSTTFWFVPTQTALPSLMYFFGKHGEVFGPRVSSALDDKFHTYGEYFTRAYHRPNVHTDPGVITLGLWLDYDGDELYLHKVLNLLRLAHGLNKMLLSLGDSAEPFPPVKWLLLTDNPLIDHLCSDAGLKDMDSLEMTKHPYVFVQKCTAYLSLDECSTAYDPLCTIIGDKMFPCQVFASPRRMDMLGVPYTPLSEGMLQIIGALMSRGSPGVPALLENFAAAYGQFLQTVAFNIAGGIVTGQK